MESKRSAGCCDKADRQCSAGVIVAAALLWPHTGVIAPLSGARLAQGSLLLEVSPILSIRRSLRVWRHLLVLLMVPSPLLLPATTPVCTWVSPCLVGWYPIITRRSPMCHDECMQHAGAIAAVASPPLPDVSMLRAPTATHRATPCSNPPLCVRVACPSDTAFVDWSRAVRPTFSWLRFYHLGELLACR